MLGEKIKSRRKILGMSQKRLAEISGIGQSSISRYETGDGGITLDYILNLAKVSSVLSIVYFLLLTLSI